MFAIHILEIIAMNTITTTMTTTITTTTLTKIQLVGDPKEQWVMAGASEKDQQTIGL